MSNVSHFVDADSQGTGRWAALPGAWLIDERVQSLLNAKGLWIGHSMFGEFHHIVALVVQDLSGGVRREILQDIEHHCMEALGGWPDFVLFPGYSTISYFLEESEDQGCLPKHCRVVLTSAFRSFHRFELRLEMSGRQVKKIQQSRELRILFLDDSRSSGETERQALSAFQRARAWKLRIGEGRSRTKEADKWLTYCILSRGKRWTPEQQVICRQPSAESELGSSVASRPDLPGGILTWSASFANIGPESTGATTCPFVPAARLVKSAIMWTKHCRPQITDALAQVFECVRPNMLKPDLSRAEILHPKAAAHFLHLCSLDLPRSARRLETPQNLTPHQVAAAGLFAALNYNDIMSYMSSKQLDQLIHCLASQVARDDSYAATIFLTMLSLMPSSVVASNYENILTILVRNLSPNTASAALALLLVGFELVDQDSISDSRRVRANRTQSTLLLSGDDLTTIQRRRAELVVNINRHLLSLEERTSGQRNEHAWIVSRDMLPIGSGPGVGDVVSIARHLVSLLYPGAHSFFLMKQLETLRTCGIDLPLRTMTEALDCAEELARHLHVDISLRLADFRSAIGMIQAGTRNQRISEEIERSLETTGRDLHNYLWREGPFAAFFCSGTQIIDSLKTMRDNLKAKLPSHPENDDFFLVLPPAPQVEQWHTLSLTAEGMNEHLKNLFENPFQHYYGPTKGDLSSESLSYLTTELRTKRLLPLIVSFCAVDPTSQRLKLVVASHGAAPNSAPLLNAAHGLGIASLRLGALGGRVQYLYPELGLQGFGDNILGTPTHKQLPVALTLYRNLFVSEFPLLWESKYEDHRV